MAWVLSYVYHSLHKRLQAKAEAMGVLVKISSDSGREEIPEIHLSPTNDGWNKLGKQSEMLCGLRKVDWRELINILRRMGVDWRDRRLIGNLYMGQKRRDLQSVALQSNNVRRWMPFCVDYSLCFDDQLDACHLLPWGTARWQRPVSAIAFGSCRSTHTICQLGICGDSFSLLCLIFALTLNIRS